MGRFVAAAPVVVGATMIVGYVIRLRRDADGVQARTRRHLDVDGSVGTAVAQPVAERAPRFAWVAKEAWD